MKDGPSPGEEAAFYEALKNYQKAEAELKKEDNAATREQLLAALKALNKASRELKIRKQENIPAGA